MKGLHVSPILLFALLFGLLGGAAAATQEKAVIHLAPLLGLVFVMFLPLVGFAMMLRLMGTKVAHLMAAVAADGVRVLRPGESLEGTVRIVVEVPA